MVSGSSMGGRRLVVAKGDIRLQRGIVGRGSVCSGLGVQRMGREEPQPEVKKHSKFSGL